MADCPADYKGLYVGISLSKESNKNLSNFFRQFNIPNFDKDVLKHATIIYSKKFIDVKLSNELYTVDRFLYDVFDTQSGKKCLVLKLVCPFLSKRHSELMVEYGLVYDYPTYNPHITISYDIGDFDISKLIPFTEELVLENEYKTELDLCLEE